MRTIPAVSVLIVNWNTRELLMQCLDSLDRAEVGGMLEVIVVDNGSDDGSIAAVRARSVLPTVIENANNVGFGAAVNQADSVATAPYRLLLNSDTIVPAGTIGTCVETLGAHADWAGVGCRLINGDGTHQSSIFRFPSLWGVGATAAYLSTLRPSSDRLNWARYGHRNPTTAEQVDVVMGSFLLLDRSAIPQDDSIFDEGYFMYGEETDLCRRVLESGRKIVYAPSVCVTHLHGASSRTPEQLAWAEESKRRATLRFLRKWRQTPVAWFANLEMLIGLGPRWAAWSLADMRDAVAHRATVRRRLRAGAARFHLRAVWRPSTMDEAWGPPPVDRPA